MWIVRLALDRPYTFVVLALLILITTPLVVLRTPTDIFPNIDIPVIAVGWSYTGLNPEEMEGRITSVYERVLTTLVDNIEHIESTTYPGRAIVRVFLQPGASLDTANAQVTAASQTILARTAAGYPAAPGHELQRVERADPATWAVQRFHFGVSAQRSRDQLCASAIGDRTRCRRALPVRRQNARR